jgi:hypothetical protein
MQASDHSLNGEYNTSPMGPETCRCSIWKLATVERQDGGGGGGAGALYENPESCSDAPPRSDEKKFRHQSSQK